MNPPAALLERCLRTAERYEIVLFDRLSEPEQDVLSDLRRDPQLYGVLRPTDGSGGTLKTISRETALLLYSLREPGPLPRYIVRGTSVAEAEQRVVEMVLDGVLEVADGDEFISGHAALDLLRDRPAPSPADGYADGRIASISRRALRHVDAMALPQAARIAARLYAYHCTPWTARWSRRLPDGDAVLRFLGCRRGAVERSLQNHWAGGGMDTTRPWLSWTRRHREPTSSISEATHKLYISPLLDDLPRAFAVALNVLPATRALSFKLGNSVSGLLRCDKWVIYFSSFDDLAEAASKLASELDGIRPQGVPFTSEIAAGGLLSWGMDPPRSERLPGQESQSWRFWIVRNLAACMAQAAVEGATVDRWRFAVERLRLRGVDTMQWTPSPALWRAAT